MSSSPSSANDYFDITMDGGASATNTFTAQALVTNLISQVSTKV